MTSKFDSKVHARAETVLAEIQREAKTKHCALEAVFCGEPDPASASRAKGKSSTEE